MIFAGHNTKRNTSRKHFRVRRSRRLGARLVTLATLAMATAIRLVNPTHAVQAQQQFPSSNCVATMENRSTVVNADGTYTLQNMPVAQGTYRVRVLCTQPDGSSLGFTSNYQTLTPGGTNTIPLQPLTALVPQSAGLNLVVNSGSLSSLGATVQLQTQAIDTNGFATDVTLATAGTTYSTSNTQVATVSGDGLVTATGPGTVVVTARNDGLVSTINLNSFGALDSDGDGMPDAWEIANGLNPYDPSDAGQDPDGDGLTNLQEYQLGTNPHVADTDGDGLSDGQEVLLGTNPLNPDTDGDGLTDGQEVALGTNPLLADTDGDGIPDGVEVKIGTNPLVPDATTTVVGFVTQPNGRPFSGASVSAITYFTAVTDTTGAFTLLHVPVTLGNIIASAEGIVGTTVYNGASQPTQPVGGGTTNVGTIQLGQSSGMVSGTVMSPTGGTVANASVTVVDGTDTRTTLTNAAGVYSAAGLQSGTVMVSVFDPETSLRGQATGAMVGSGPLTLNVTLGGYGTISGTVKNTAGASVGAGATVTITGALAGSTITDPTGHYSFSFVPLGLVTLDATDSNGNHGRTTVTISATSQTVSQDIQYLGRGTVSGTVTSNGNAVAGATVSLRNNGIFGGTQTTVANSLGQYSFGGVFLGNLGLSAQSGALGGTATTSITADGQAVTANIAVTATGTIAGTVLRADGKTTVPGASVSLQNQAYAANADASGNFSLPNVPVGAYTLIAFDNGTGDRGSAGVNLSGTSQTATQNITMLGLGTVNVTVQDGGGTPKSNAQVTINGGGVFQQQQTAVTNASGVATFNQQLAGTEQVSAKDPTTGLQGNGSVALTAGGTAAITVQLQPYGSVSGTVYQLDGKTPVVGIEVAADNGVKTQTNASGQYTLNIIPSGTHTVSVVDASGNTLAYNNSVTISTQGQQATANFIIVGRGTVTGKVTHSDGSAAAGDPVEIISQAPGITFPYGSQTDVNGNYTVANVPVGNYVATSQENNSTGTTYGQSPGTMTTNGANVVTNIVLTPAVPAAQNFIDANGSVYPIQENGSLSNGSYDVFAGDADPLIATGNNGNPNSPNQGGALLSLVQSGTETAFTGNTMGTSSLNGQELSIRQAGLDGLNVTREIYIPNTGYFARYVELLQNPTSAAITVDAKLKTFFRPGNVILTNNGTQYSQEQLPHILLTSSGDTVLNVNDPSTPDTWVTFGGLSDMDVFTSFRGLQRTIPPIADVFAGSGAMLKPTAATFTQDSSGNFSTLVETFGAVTVPANSTVGIMHFVSQQNVYAAANGSAARLAQLPPEALYGLTSTDLSSIQNFAVPSNGVSSVAALPSLNGSVSGFVYATDGTTGIPSAGIALVSSLPEFQRTMTFASGAAGAYAFQGGPGAVMPEAPYTVVATHPVTGEVTPTATGTFTSGSDNSSQNVIFSNDGEITGVVSLGPTVVNASGTVTLTGGALSPYTVSIAGDGSFVFSGLPTGNYTLVANVTNTLLTGTATSAVTAGQVTTTNVTIQPAGNISGQVTLANGALAIGDVVNLRQSGAALSSTTVDTSGHYLFTNVPAGNYTIDCYDSGTNEAASAPVTVAQNSSATQNLVLQSSGMVQGTVTTNDGSSVAGITVTLVSTTSQNSQTLTTSASNTGAYTFTNVSPGSLTVSATSSSGLKGSANGALPVAGQTVTLNLPLQATGSVSGTVTQAGGTTPASGIVVSISPAPLSGSSSVTTNSAGGYSFSNVPFGGFTLTGVNPSNGDRGGISSSIESNGQARVLNFSMNGVGTVSVTVLSGTGTPVAGASVYLSTYFGQNLNANTNSSGIASFSNVPAGSVSVNASDPVTGLAGSAYGTLTATSTLSLTVNLQAVGNLQGTVYAPDGVTPVMGATVSLSGYGAPKPVTSDGNGRYSFTNVPLGNFTISATDVNGVLRQQTTVSLQTAAQTVTQNLTYIGMGTVSGLVTKADGTPLENATLQVVDRNTVLGGTRSVTTGGDGTYSVTNLPIGTVMITVEGLPTSTVGFGQTQIANDGQTVTLNIQLANSAITLPLTLTDADGYLFKVQGDGSFNNFTGYTGINPFYDAQAMSAVVNGTNYRFDDGSVPVTALQSLNGQQFEINQPDMGPLNVTRKVYVPADGYFARRVDVFQNPTSSPVTLQLNISSLERYVENAGVQITGTSAGTTFDKTTQWMVSTSSNGQAFGYPVNQPAVAEVYEGTGATATLQTASQSLNTTYQNTGQGYNSFTTQYLAYGWNTVTVPANGQVAFLFFIAQESTSATGISAAKRLVQLPAEALAGMTSTDLASVVNFVIPSSPLPAITAPQPGSVSGVVYAGDAQTPVPAANVYEQSTDLYFGSGAAATADGQGNFGLSVAALSGYALQALDPNTYVTSAQTTGAVTAGANSVVQNVVFTGTGIVQGTIQTTGTSTQIKGSSIYYTLPCYPGHSGYCGSNNNNLGTNLTFSLLTIPAGTLSLNASVVLNSGFAFYLPNSSGQYFAFNVSAGQTTQFSMVVPATGNLQGQVLNADNTPATGVTVNAVGTAINEGISTTTDGNGNYTFTSSPVDMYSISATDPADGYVVTKTGQVTQDATTTVNLQFAGKNTVNATVSFANGGTSTQNSALYMSTATRPTFTYIGTPDSSGHFTFTNIPPGTFSVRAYYPGQSFYSTTTTTISGNGNTTSMSIVLPPVGTVSGVLTNADGSSPGANVYVYANDHVSQYTGYAATDSNGNFAFYPVPADRVVDIKSTSPTSPNGRTIVAQALNQQVPGDGQTLTVNLRYPGESNVKVLALDASSKPLPNVTAYIKGTDNQQFYYGTTGSDGTVTLNNIVEGSFVAWYQNTGYPNGGTSFTQTPAMDGTTSNVTVNASPVGTVQGSVYASDGTTLLTGGNVNVTMTDVLTGVQNGGNFTSPQQYVFSNANNTTNGFSLSATFNNDNTTTQTSTGNITAANQTITKNFTMPVWSVSGKVFLNDGVTPVPNITVVACVQATPGAGCTSYQTSTDSNGNFQMSGVALGSLVMSATDNNGITGSSSAVQLPNVQTILTGTNVLLGPAGTVSGTVYDSMGNPQPNVNVDIASAVNGNYYDQSVTTDGNGFYTASDVTTGQLILTATLSSGSTETANATLVNNGDTITVNLGADPAVNGEIFGTVYDENGNPNPGATVTVQAAAPSTFTTTVTADSNGLYQANQLPLGSLTVQATLTDSTQTDPVTGTVSTAFQPVEFDLGLQNPGNVTGVVVDKNGTPIPNIDVEIVSAGDTTGTYYDTGTGTDGSYAFSNIVPGVISATVYDNNGNAIGTASATLPYGGNVTINISTTTVGAALSLPHLGPSIPGTQNARMGEVPGPWVRSSRPSAFLRAAIHSMQVTP